MKWWRILLAFTWELPQTILALFLILLTRGDQRESMKYAIVFWRQVYWGVSLGMFILLGRSYSGMLADRTKKHEHGHTIQSMMLGPLYLIVVGLPSIVFNILTRFRILSWGSYYTRYPENWADQLGGVDERSYV